MADIYNTVTPTSYKERAMKLFNRLKELEFSTRSAPIALFGLGLIAFGIFIPWMGFYWDDWPWMWFSHISGPEILRRLEFHRPLSNWMFSIGAQILGETPLPWQILNLTIRWLSGFAVWWTVKQIWPKRKEPALWIALLFMIYPGFTQQFVSVNSSRHILALTLFIISLGTMVTAIRNQKNCWSLTALTIIITLTSMLLTEYYYGLEFLRPLIIWLVLESSENRWRNTVKQSFIYLITLAAILYWRITISQYGNYSISIIEAFKTDLPAALTKYSRTVLEDAVEVSWGAWSQIFSFPSTLEYGLLPTLYFWIFSIVSALGIFFFLIKFKSDSSTASWAKSAIGIGILSLLVGGLSIWSTDLVIKLYFPPNRFTLIMMFGASLILAGLLELLIRSRGAKLALLSIIIGLSAGFHFRNALLYIQDWNYAERIFTHLTWRIPGIMPATTILSEQFPADYSTDNSLSALFNWVFAPDFSPDLPTDIWYYDNQEFNQYPPDYTPRKLPLMLLYLRLRLGGDNLPDLEEDTEIYYPYRFLPFEGSTSNAIVLFYRAPNCVRVLDPIYDQHLPQMREYTLAAIHLSNLDRLVIKANSPPKLPEEIFGPELPADWCYYFEKADLARQFGDWQQVADLGTAAFLNNFSPYHPSELIPFIEAFAHVGRWEEAENLTTITIRSDPLMRAMLCDTWNRIVQDIPSDQDEFHYAPMVINNLACALLID